MSGTEDKAIPSFNEFDVIVFKEHIAPIETIKNAIEYLCSSEHNTFLSRYNSLKVTFHDQLNDEHDTLRSQYNNLTFAMELFKYQLSVHRNIYQRFTYDAFQSVFTFLEDLEEQLIVNRYDLEKMNDYISWAQTYEIMFSSIEEEDEKPVEDLANLTECEIMDDEDNNTDADEDDEDEANCWTVKDLDLITDVEDMLPTTKSIGRSRI
ncbi:hypothetical protein GGI35DRAFT_480778 [Trichoderma velutinum]